MTERIDDPGEGRRFPWIPAIVLVVGVATTLLGVASLGEALWLRHWASEARVAEYHFGSEASVSHGGRRYESLGSYTRRELLDGTALSFCGLVLASAGVRLGRARS